MVFLGIGNELNGDDAAGVIVIRRLRERIGDTPDVLLLEGGTAPESFSGPIRRFGADLVVMIDCADMQGAPGEIAWLDFADLDGLSASTHTLPPSVLAGFLQGEIGCEIGLIGIQPETLEFDSPLSASVNSAVEEIVREISKGFTQHDVHRNQLD